MNVNIIDMVYDESDGEPNMFGYADDDAPHWFFVLKVDDYDEFEEWFKTGARGEYEICHKFNGGNPWVLVKTYNNKDAMMIRMFANG